MRTKQIVSIIGLAALALLAVTGIANLEFGSCNFQFPIWLSALGHWLLSPLAGGLVLAAAPIAIPVDDLNGVVGDIKEKLGDLENLSGRFKGMEEDNAQLRRQLQDVRR